MLFFKIVHGYVVQSFNDAGEFLSQEFVVDDTIDYEINETMGGGGLPINQDDMPLAGREYHSFDMVQK